MAERRQPAKDSADLDDIAAKAMNPELIGELELSLAAERREPPERLARCLPGCIYVGPSTWAVA